MHMVREGLHALDEKTQQPLELDTYCTTNAPYRNAFDQQAFDEPTLVLREEVWLAALDALASPVVVLIVLFAIMNRPICNFPN